MKSFTAAGLFFTTRYSKIRQPRIASFCLSIGVSLPQSSSGNCFSMELIQLLSELCLSRNKEEHDGESSTESKLQTQATGPCDNPTSCKQHVVFMRTRKRDVVAKVLPRSLKIRVRLYVNGPLTPPVQCYIVSAIPRSDLSAIGNAIVRPYLSSHVDRNRQPPPSISLGRLNCGGAVFEPTLSFCLLLFCVCLVQGT